MPVSNLRPIYRMRLVATTLLPPTDIALCDAKVAPISINKMRLTQHVGPTSRYYKSHGVNWPLTDFYLVRLSLLKSP